MKSDRGDTDDVPSSLPEEYGDDGFLFGLHEPHSPHFKLGLRSFLSDAVPSSPATSADPCAATRHSFRLTPAQERVRDFLSPNTPYNSLLLMHGVGVGKTCTAISVAERWLNVTPVLRNVGREIQNKYVDQRPIVLLPAHLKNAFLKQILDVSKLSFVDNRLASDDVNQCAGNKYLKMIPDRHMLTPDNLQKKVLRLIADKFYQVMSHMEFANHIEKLEQQVQRVEVDAHRQSLLLLQRLKDMFSERVIIVDEVHNLRPDATGNPEAKKLPPRLMRVLAAADNVKLLLMSATPMFNDAREIVSVANIIAANDKLPELRAEDIFDADGFPTKSGRAQLTRALYGKVSHVPGQDPFTFPVRLFPDRREYPVPKYDIQGDLIPAHKRIDATSLKLCVSFFSGMSLKCYEYAKHIDATNESDEDASDMHLGMHVSNVCFPSEHLAIKPGYAATMFTRCFRTQQRRGQYVFSYLPGVPRFLEPGMIRQYAPKIAEIVDNIIESEGIVLVYSAYLQAGVIPVALALEHRGFYRYNYGNILSDANAPRTERRHAYVILTGNRALTSTEQDLADAHSYANANGNIVKVILCTRKASEGLDMKCVRAVHVLDPWYHLNRIEQIIGRACRNCSHAWLPPNKRNTMIYLHACAVAGAKEESADMRVYRIAQHKQKAIDVIAGLLHDISVEAILSPNTADRAVLTTLQTTPQGEDRTVFIEVANPEHQNIKTQSIAVLKTHLHEAQYVIDHLHDVFATPGRYVSIREIVDILSIESATVARCMEYIAMHRPDLRIRRAGNYYAQYDAVLSTRSFGVPFPLITDDTVARESPEEVFQRCVRGPAEELVRELEHVDDNIRNCVVDMYVDRLSERETEMVVIWLRTVSEKQNMWERLARTSLTAAGMLRRMDGTDVIYHARSDEYRVCDTNGTIREATVLENAVVQNMQSDMMTVVNDINSNRVWGIMQHARHGVQFRINSRGKYMRCEGFDTNVLTDILKHKQLDKTVRWSATKNSPFQGPHRRRVCTEVELTLRLNERVVRTAIFYAFIHLDSDALRP